MPSVVLFGIRFPGLVVGEKVVFLFQVNDLYHDESGREVVTRSILPSINGAEI